MQVNDHVDDETPITPISNQPIPSSPPPSFRSRASSPTSRRLLSTDPFASEAEQTLADTFDDGEDSDAENEGDDRQRLMRGNPETVNNAEGNLNDADRPGAVQRRVTELPAFTPPVSRTAPRPTNDGVFANLSAKPERGEKNEEQPPVS